MMTGDQRTTVTSVGAMVFSPILEFYHSILIFLLLAILLIIADTRFGIEAARKRGELIRPSRAIRRAINKIIDYICWASVAGVFSSAYGHILGIPLLTAFVMLGVYSVEIISIINNYFEARGYKFRVSMKKVFGAMWGKVSDKDILEDKDDEGKGE